MRLLSCFRAPIACTRVCCVPACSGHMYASVLHAHVFLYVRLLARPHARASAACPRVPAKSDTCVRSTVQSSAAHSVKIHSMLPHVHPRPSPAYGRVRPWRPATPPAFCMVLTEEQRERIQQNRARAIELQAAAGKRVAAGEATVATDAVVLGDCPWMLVLKKAQLRTVSHLIECRSACDAINSFLWGPVGCVVLDMQVVEYFLSVAHENTCDNVEHTCYTLCMAFVSTHTCPRACTYVRTCVCI